MGIADLRREYTVGSLRRADLAPDPIVQFKYWLDSADGRKGRARIPRFLIGLYKSFMLLTGAETADVNAAALATADKTGRPSVRFVLLKGVDERGFAFFTNYESRKGCELADNPNAALVFYWSELERQVCVTGTVSQLPARESDAYFESRPKGSRLATWASQQSVVIENRAALEQRWEQSRAKYPGDKIPRPPHWGGYVLCPEQMEFWQGRASRLHDRFRYTRQPGGSWRVDRLAP
jgi:pyridoxamine 5'-phosphate oxidase